MAYDSRVGELTDSQKTERIKTVVSEAGRQLRERHPVLKYQNAIGASILALALAGMVGSGWLYIAGTIPAWLCIPLVAFFASLTHELEHDLIHWMYFRGKPWAHHLMMGLVWLARASTVNPWIRRGLHFHHHKYSGTESDVEERAITNGERWGLRRLLMTGDNMLSILLRLGRLPDWKQRGRMLLRGLMAYFPLGWAFWGAWYAFLGFHITNGVALLAGGAIDWSAGTLAVMEVLNVAAVVYLIPNLLRTFCLHFVSSNMHYFGDVEAGNVIQQTQVLNPWWLLPFQAFCFNFGSTHAIHHFVVKEPFYIRQITAPTAHRVMREMGVRFNDTGTFRRANRWGDERATA
ncbi:fatty acid desaturase [Algiphilus aromaticivorans]|uniref:fatty acid desaturase n=1 Tax=Algiphilus aromaticivorans TaxID=382454 RepID=UPI0005C1A9BD|nr:fatty acid desaturase [Algiphilus aromaticivorans]